MVSNSTIYSGGTTQNDGGSLHFIFAPPGFGKTTGLLQIFRDSGVSLVFLSPLRAIAEEVRVRAECEGFLTQWGARRAPEFQMKQVFICATFESFEPQYFDSRKYLFVIDEFHLLFYWESFRPLLLEKLYALSAMNANVLALSATMKKELFSRATNELCLGFNQFYFHDLGGGRLLHHPDQMFSFQFLSPFEELMMCALYLKVTQTKGIIFVSHRHQVPLVVNFLQKMRFSAIGCVGGHAQTFHQQWTGRDYQVVVATTVLSHGVNLGALRLACFLYPVSCEDFYLQMLARAGRDGRGFIVMHRQGQKGVKNLWEFAAMGPLKLLCALFILFFGRVKLGGCKQRLRASS